MTILRSLLILVGIVASSYALAQGEDCENADQLSAEKKIAACTVIIESLDASRRDISLAFFHRGNAFAAQGQIDKAISDYDKSLEIVARPEAFHNRGLFYYHQGNVERAIADYSEAIRLNPNYIDAYTNRAIAYHIRLKDLPRAIADYSKILQLKPDHIDIRINRASAYRDTKEFDLAIDDFSAVVKLSPNNAMAYYGRAIAYGGKKDWKSVETDLRTAIRLGSREAAELFKKLNFK